MSVLIQEFGAQRFVAKEPYSVLVTETQLTVGVANVLIFTALTTKSYLCVFTNNSPAAQTIRIGSAPSFGAPPLGMPLTPLDQLTLYDVRLTLNAIGSAAGGLLEVLILRTA